MICSGRETVAIEMVRLDGDWKSEIASFTGRFAVFAYGSSQ